MGSSSADELDGLLRELAERRRNGGCRVLRFRLRHFAAKAESAARRSADIVVASAAILALLPVFVATWAAIRLTSRGRAIFVQTRVGRHGRPFAFYKFRSMVEDAEKLRDGLICMNESSDGVIFKIQADPRVTPVGRIIRKLSIDELPQLWNVVKGDMSLVGPRPPLPSEVAQYTPEERKRLDVKPGLTCLWQVSGRSEIPFNEQCRLDEEYIRTQGPWSDVKILLRTVPAIFSGRGAW